MKVFGRINSSHTIHGCRVTSTCPLDICHSSCLPSDMLRKAGTRESVSLPGESFSLSGKIIEINIDLPNNYPGITSSFRVEKYRPKTLDDLISHTDIINTSKS